MQLALNAAEPGPSLRTHTAHRLQLGRHMRRELESQTDLMPSRAPPGRAKREGSDSGTRSWLEHSESVGRRAPLAILICMIATFETRAVTSAVFAICWRWRPDREWVAGGLQYIEVKMRAVRTGDEPDCPVSRSTVVDR